MKVVKSYLRPLLSNITSDRMVEFKFRTPNEVASFMASFRGLLSSDLSAMRQITASVTESNRAWVTPVMSVAGIPIKPVKSIDAKKLKELTSVLSSTYLKIRSLKTVRAIIESLFTQNAQELLPKLDALELQVETDMHTSMDCIGKLAKSLQPAEFSKFCKALTVAVVQGLDGAYSGVFTKLFITHTHKGPLFTYMIEFIDLESPYSGYVYPQYFVILSGQVCGNRMHLSCRTSHEFVLPDEMTTNGATSNSIDEMLHAVSSLLSDDQFHHAVIAPGSLKKRELTPILEQVPGVIGVDVEKSKIKVHFGEKANPGIWGNHISRIIQDIFSVTPRWKLLPGTHTIEFQLMLNGGTK